MVLALDCKILIQFDIEKMEHLRAFYHDVKKALSVVRCLGDNR